MAETMKAYAKEQWQRDIEQALIECERGHSIGEVLANYRSVRRTVLAIREADAALSEGGE